MSSSSASTASSTIDNEKLQQFMGKILSDFGRPITSQELSNLTSTAELYIREWLANQAAAGYLTYDSASQRYTLPYELAQALVNENSPAYVAGGFQVMMSFYLDAPKILEVFKTGKGIAWGDHNKDLYQGTERFFRPGYTANLVSSWIPAFDNGKVEET